MTTTLAAPALPIPRVRRRVFGLLLWAWRTALLLLLVATASQPVTIALYLSGTFPMIGAHGLVGSLLAGLAMLTALLGIGYALAGGRVWVIPVSVLLFLGCGFQIGMGYARTLAVHVPLGVALVSVTLLLAVWSWTRSAACFREGRGRRDEEPELDERQPPQQGRS